MHNRDYNCGFLALSRTTSALRQRFFEVARTLKDRPLLDIARVNLGVARGQAKMGVSSSLSSFP